MQTGERDTFTELTQHGQRKITFFFPLHYFGQKKGHLHNFFPHNLDQKRRNFCRIWTKRTFFTEWGS